MRKHSSFTTTCRDQTRETRRLVDAIRDFEHALDETRKPAPEAPLGEHVRFGLRAVWRDVACELKYVGFVQLYYLLVILGYGALGLLLYGLLHLL